MKELKVGCGKPTGAKVGEPEKAKESTEKIEERKEASMAAVRVGQKAPDFEAPAYQDGKFGQTQSPPGPRPRPPPIALLPSGRSGAFVKPPSPVPCSLDAMTMNLRIIR